MPRIDLVAELHAISRTLREHEIPYAVCGGVAVTMHGATRTTKDIDLLVPSDRIQEVLEALRPLGYLFPALPMTFGKGTGRERSVQRVTKVVGEEHLVIDLIAAAAAFEGLLDDRLEVPLPEGPVCLVSLRSLATMKRLAGRPQDLADLIALGLEPGPE